MHINFRNFQPNFLRSKQIDFIRFFFFYFYFSISNRLFRYSLYSLMRRIFQWNFQLNRFLHNNSICVIELFNWILIDLVNKFFIFIELRDEMMNRVATSNSLRVGETESDKKEEFILCLSPPSTEV